MVNLQGKVAVVTGAGRGLGRAHALALGAAGARVIVNDVSVGLDGELDGSNQANAVVAELRALGTDAYANNASVANWAGAESIITDALSHFGRLDVVINNAGINRSHRLVDLSEQDVDAEISTHLKGSIAVSHFAARHWSTVGPEVGRCIINTSSSAGLHPTSGGGVYGAAKSAVAALTVSHAQDLAELGVRVNAIVPCARTRMVEASPLVLRMMPTSTTDFDRYAPEHVSPLVVYLASDDNRFTGRVFGIEGPDLVLYRPFSADQQWHTDPSWSPQDIADQLRDVDQRVLVHAFIPNGVIDQFVPPGSTLKRLPPAGA
jgi:NAD(P)-dependent dehydrogenase (short-subunit alcohol dehydrogenase family)